MAQNRAITGERVNSSLGTIPTLSVEVQSTIYTFQSTIYTFLSLLMWPCHKFWTFRPPWHVDDLAWSKRYQIFLSAQVSIHIGHKREARPSGLMSQCNVASISCCHFHVMSMVRSRVVIYCDSHLRQHSCCAFDHQRLNMPTTASFSKVTWFIERGCHQFDLCKECIRFTDFSKRAQVASSSLLKILKLKESFT